MADGASVSMSEEESALVGSPHDPLMGGGGEIVLPADITYHVEPMLGPGALNRLRHRLHHATEWTCADGKTWGMRLASFFVSPFFFAICWFLGTMYFDCVLQVVAEKRILLWWLHASFDSGEGVLPDIGFAITPRITFDALADYWVYAVIVITVVRFVATSMRWTIIRRYMAILGALFLLRAFTIVLTTLPQPQSTCVATAVGNTWIEGFLIMAGVHKTCRDLFFSGHAVNLTIACLCWHQYSHVVPIIECDDCERRVCKIALTRSGYLQRCTAMKVLVWIPFSIGIFLVIATRLHYTIDVLIGALLTLLTWDLYHRLITTSHLNNNRFLMWFERGAPDLHIIKIAPAMISRSTSIDV